MARSPPFAFDTGCLPGTRSIAAVRLQRMHGHSVRRRGAQRSVRSRVQVHVFCKYLSRPILSHTLTPARMPPSTSYFTLATAWKPNSTYLLASLSTGSCHILSMGNDDA